MICKVMPRVWQLRSRASHDEIGLFAFERECLGYLGDVEKNSKLFEWSEVECDAVFVVMKEGDHYDGGDQLHAVTATLAKAEAIIVDLKNTKQHRSDEFSIEVHRVQS